MRANADDDGVPTTRLCRDAELRIGLHDAHEFDDGRPVIRLSASSGSISSKSSPQPDAEVAHVAGFEAGVVVSAAIDDAVAVRVFRLPSRDRLFFSPRNVVVIGIAQHEI